MENKCKMTLFVGPIIARGTKVSKPPTIGRAIERAIRSNKQHNAYGYVERINEKTHTLTIAIPLGPQMDDLLKRYNLTFVTPYNGIPIFPSEHIVDQMKA